MKKIVIILVLIILVGAGVFFIVSRRSLTMEQIFPSRALIYTRFSHVGTDLGLYEQSSFWKNISSVDLPKVLEHNHVPARDIKRLVQVQKEMEMFFSSPLTRKFLGNEIAAAFYEKEDGLAKESLDSYDVLCATRLGFSLQMAELFASMASQWADDITTTTERYGGVNIVHVHFSKRKLDLQYIRLNDVLFVSFSPSNILHDVIKVHQTRQPSLVMDPNFSKTFSHTYAQGHAVFYLNIQRFLDILNQNLPKVQKKNFHQLSQASVGFKSYVLSYWPGETSKMKMIMQFEPEKLNSYWHSLLTCTAGPNTSLKFIPHDVVMYNWGQCYDFKEMMANVNNDIQDEKSKEAVNKWGHSFEKHLKLNISNDVLPVLGSQVGWYLNDIDTQGLFPYPRGVAFIKINDAAAADGLMKKLTKSSLALMQQEDYQQSSIHYMTLPLGTNMDPGYTFLGDYLLVGSSRETLKTSIDAFHNSNQSLLSIEALKQFHIDESSLNQGVAYIKIDDLCGRLQQLLDWYNKVVSSQITGALAYQQEAQDRQKELQESFTAKKEELSLAKNKFKDLQSKFTSTTTTEMTDEEKVNQQSNLDHLSSDIKILQEDVDSFKKQDQELKHALITYKNQAEAAKAWLFNSDEVLKPVLKAFESLHTLGMKWYLNEQMSETEIFIK
jgi:hypothetical protein